MPKIAIRENGFVYLRVYIKHNFQVQPEYFNFIVDSGATCTTIDKKALRLLGYDDNWIIENGSLREGNRRPSTATGEIIDDCYEIKLPAVRIGKWTSNYWRFLVRLCDDDTKQFNLLFGTDSMKFFTWFFDYENGYCEYNGIVNKKHTTFDVDEQFIQSIDEEVKS